jgi:hypothetical protein
MNEAKVFVESWAQSHGSPYLVKNDDAGASSVELVEDSRSFRIKAATDVSVGCELVFVDGVRRGEASLYQVLDDGSIVRGIAGAHACGAVVAAPGRPVTFEGLRVSRMVIWGAGRAGDLPDAPGGWRWDSHSVASDDPQAPLDELQQRMRRAEGQLAASLCRTGRLVVADGPLDFALRRDQAIVGYIKTHRRALLEPALHVRVPELRARERTPVFRIGDERYSCYARLIDPAPDSGPWAGIVRFEFPASTGLTDARSAFDELAACLPRFAGVPHRDPRAPQNLQPIGALEWRLRHLLGPAPLADRAVRDAIHQLRSQPPAGVVA